MVHKIVADHLDIDRPNNRSSGHRDCLHISGLPLESVSKCASTPKSSCDDDGSAGRAAASQLQSPSISAGSGLISTSGTVVTGHATSFKTDLRIGDAIMANTQKGEEMRIVTMVLSQISISISSAFSSDLKTPTQYKFINKPRDVNKEKADRARKAMADKEEVERLAMGTYGNKGEIVYREKTEHGSYRIRREQADGEMSRSDLLSARSKKKSDRYC